MPMNDEDLHQIKGDLTQLKEDLKEHIDLRLKPISDALENNKSEHNTLFDKCGDINRIQVDIAEVRARQKTVFAIMAAIGTAVLGVIAELFFGRKQ